MIRRLLRRFRADTPAAAATINLVGDVCGGQQPTPAPIGIDASPGGAAWSVARLEQIIRRCNAQPSDAQAQLEARHARHRLSRFWLEAPIDQLEILYRGAVGRAYRELLLGSLPGLPLAPDEASWKESLARRLQDHFEAAERPNLLLAVMPYCAPGRMRLENPLTSLPPWLLADYSHCFDPELPARALPAADPSGRGDLAPGLAAPSPSPLPSPSLPSPSLASPQLVSSPLAPAPLAPVPVLSERRGSDAFAAFEDSECIDRMIGLINLFRLDPNDREVFEELLRLRRLIGQVWLDVTPASLEPVYRSPLGVVYRELLASDLGSLPPLGEDLALRQALTQVAADQEHPAMVQALLAVMPFHPQGKMRLGPGQTRLPAWLRADFAALSGMAPGL